MGWTLVDSGTFPFADGDLGHVCDLGSAPAVGQLDVLCVSSDTTVDTPPGFTLAGSRVQNQGAYLWYRVATGGEGSTVTINTGGNFNCQVSWQRWAGVDHFDVGAVAGADASAGSSTPAVSTGTLASTGELVVAFGAVHGAVTSAPSWSAGYTPLTAVTQGSGAATATGYVAYRTDAGTAAETPQVSWTTPAPDRYILVAAFVAAASVTVGQAVETDTAQPVTRQKIRATGQATETDTAQPVTGVKAQTIGQAVETDTAAAVTRVKIRTLGQALETDTATTVIRSKKVTLGQASETDTAAAVEAPSSGPRYGFFLATGTVSILRGESTDDYGDPIDAATVVATGVPASIIENARRVFVPAESRTTVVRMFAGRVAYGVDVREQDRLRDEATATIYLVEGVSAPASPFGQADVRLDLRRIDD